VLLYIKQRVIGRTHKKKKILLSSIRVLIYWFMSSLMARDVITGFA